jgi:hypothetical protein
MLVKYVYLFFYIRRFIFWLFYPSLNFLVNFNSPIFCNFLIYVFCLKLCILFGKKISGDVRLIQILRVEVCIYQ